MTRYFVVNEHTLCYRINDALLYGVLAGSVLRGGHDPKNGPIAVSHPDTVRAATKADFQFFRVDPTGHLDD